MVDTSSVRDALRDVYDPEIPVNIVDLGLIYDIIDREEGRVHVEMTLTSMGCPISDQMKRNVTVSAESVDGVEEASVELVWDPPWSPAKATEEGRLQLQSLGISLPDAEAESDGSSAQPSRSPF